MPSFSAYQRTYNSAIILWNEPSSNGGSPIIGYKIIFNGVLSPTTLPSTQRSEIISPLNANAWPIQEGSQVISYSLGVVAINGVGNSSINNVTTVTLYD